MKSDEMRLAMSLARQEYAVGIAYLPFDRAEAGKHFLNCVELFRQLQGQNHPNTGMALLAWGRTLELDSAKPILTEAIEIFRADAARPLRLAKALEALGDALSGFRAKDGSYSINPPGSNDHDHLRTDLLAAIRCYKEAQSILEAELIPWGVELVRVNKSIARCYERLGDEESSIRYNQTVIDLLGQIATLTDSLGHIMSAINRRHDVAFSSQNTLALIRMLSRSISRSKGRVATGTASAEASFGGDALPDVPNPRS